MTDVIDAGAALCAPFLRGLPVAGLSISLVSERGAQSTVGTSDRIATRLEELQFELGEGPSPDAIHSGHPVLTPDLRDQDAQEHWPFFSVAALGTGARGVFSFPMTFERATVGVVSLYALAMLPPWSDVVVTTAIGLVQAAALPAIELATRAASAETHAPTRSTEMRREVHQAAGMLMIQLDTSIDEAMVRLRAYAFSVGVPIDQVARDVVAGRLDFSSIVD